MSKKVTFAPLTDIKRPKSEIAAGYGTPSLKKHKLLSLDNTEKGYLELTTPGGLPSSRLDRVFVNFGGKNPRGFYGIEMGCVAFCFSPRSS
jgi:hypothetical protein